METRSKRLAARNTVQLDNTYEQLPGDEDQDKSNDIYSMPGLDKPPIPPRDTDRKANTDIISDRDHKRKVEGANEALHDKRPSTQSENTEQGIMEISAINKDGTIPMGENGLPLRATMPKGKNGLPLRAGERGIPSQSKKDDILKTVKHEHSGEVSLQGLEKPSLKTVKHEQSGQDSSHISYPSLDAKTFSHQGDNNYRANPRFQGDFKVPSQDQVQESQHFVSTDPCGIYQRRDEHRAENQVPSAPATIESDQYIHASVVEGISSVGDSNSQSQLNPKHQPASKERVSHTSSSDDDDTDDESLHKCIDQDIKNIAEEVSDEVNRDPSFDQTMVHVPYDPNLVCPICGKKFRIGKIQKFRKHVDACV